MRSKVLLTGLVLALLLPGVVPALANTTSGTPQLQTSGSFPAPVGFQIFCLTNPAHCRGGGGSQVRLTENVLDTLKSINNRVNRSISPRGDRRDEWVVDVSSGDCEDYALTKRAALIRAGLPAGALRIAAATTRSGIGHAVLVVRTDQGDLVLDNLTGTIKPANQTGLNWVAMTSADGRSWKKLR
jgi:predicted transglutaminase-like cysteine proteinase